MYVHEGLVSVFTVPNCLIRSEMCVIMWVSERGDREHILYSQKFSLDKNFAKPRYMYVSLYCRNTQWNKFSPMQ